MNVATRSEVAAITVYRALHHGHLSPCRFVPSCSQYALDALETYGFFRGNRLIVGRLLRCRPRGGWGADPVPVPNESGLTR